MRPLAVLTHFPTEGLDPVRDEFPAIRFTQIPMEGELEAGLEGEILVTFSAGSPNLPQVVERGVRWIHTVGTGVDQFPLAAVGDRVLTCARGTSAVPIAEWVLAVMLAFAKHLPDSWVSEPPERWSWTSLEGLQGQTLGLVGLGGIGRAVAERALAFGMRVRAVRRTPGPGPLAGVEMADDLLDLVRTAHHLVIAAPATRETRSLVNAEVLAAVNPGLHLINIARGTLIDQDALRVALDDGRIACASLDVADPEPLPAGHWLYTHPSVRLSPHISWHMPGAIEALLDSFVVNLRLYLANEPLEGIVDLEAGY